MRKEVSNLDEKHAQLQKSAATKLKTSQNEGKKKPQRPVVKAKADVDAATMAIEKM